MVWLSRWPEGDGRDA
ncbi:Protein of unknown function [Propionibacterium freudenreichii subsp. freudenreichii]|uniref:Uncharacterized protein n=1 Tax=Propionibacterium freudenreichii subsp. freudenreichii TaxID=66712 RepID=A0A0B7NS35_PROFF|nr:Protein of unknown function [Propionibacterium freudenreichii]CEP26655.1 Protein of unknown function [Propionibacterium freudenreichii subsp. freudenreichii]